MICRTAPRIGVVPARAAMTMPSSALVPCRQCAQRQQRTHAHAAAAVHQHGFCGRARRQYAMERRYVTRPALALQRLSTNEVGQVL